MSAEFRELTQGAEGPWALFLLGLPVAGAMTAWAAARARRPALAELARGEEGVAYTLPFVLLIPLYLFIVLCVFQAGFILLAKVGTMYAAHAGARSAVVWWSAEPDGLRDERVRQSVFTALAPFEWGSAGDAATAGPPPADAAEHADDFVQGVLGYSSESLRRSPPLTRPIGLDRGRNFSSGNLTRRYLCAAARTDVSPLPPRAPGQPPPEAITVTITYRAPLLFPVVGRWLDPDGAPPYEYRITSAVTLPTEAPALRDGSLGIKYQSP